MAKVCSNQLELEINFNVIGVCLPECVIAILVVLTHSAT